uniref:Uncharacterized protein n=1 Tax=Rhizophora mucronata TaxID=61149 RepID=A0A2P2MMG1_RHIMU
MSFYEVQNNLSNVDNHEKKTLLKLFCLDHGNFTRNQFIHSHVPNLRGILGL